jgi:murein DD-endopeptidase MepM/ murein hydrolase activator NlpD
MTSVRCARAVFAFALASLLAALAQPAPASADPLTDLTVRIKQAQVAVQELTTRRQSQHRVVDDLRAVTGGHAADLRRVEQDLFAAVARFREAEAALAQVEAEIASLEGQIAEKEAAVERRAGVYGTRLRGLYKFTRTSPLERLLSARDFGEALQRVTMMQAVARVDTRLLGQLRAEHQELVKARAALRQKQEQAAALRDELGQQRQSLEQRRTEQAAVAAQAQREQRQAEAAATELDEQARAQSALIVSLQAQYQRQLEEIERQRVLEEQRRAEEARRLEAQRQAALQATATAQAAAQAAAQATAQARAANQRTPATPATLATPTPRPGSGAGGDARRAPTVAPMPGTVQTEAFQPSAAGLIWPVVNPTITTEFGERNLAQNFHTGIDLAVRLYSPVRAAGDGIVLERGLAVPGKPSQSYGMLVIIAHTPTLSTLYSHLDDGNYKPVVKPGDVVKRGQLIGYVGMTGITSGPHVHFEVRISGECLNPRLYLPK